MHRARTPSALAAAAALAAAVGCDIGPFAPGSVTGLLGDRLAVPGEEAVERRVTREQGAEIARQRAGNRIARDRFAFGGEGFGEGCPVRGIGPQPVFQLAQRQVHLARVVDRVEHLLLDAPHGAVAQEGAAVDEVDQRRRVPLAAASSIPTATGRLSLKARSGMWHLAQARVPSRESTGSKKSRSPSATFSRVRGLSSGTGR
jgi:hypothetical protein